MVDIIVIISVTVVIAVAAWYIIRAKRRGQRCIGCPYCKQCQDSCGE